MYSQQDVIKAEKARALQQSIGRPSLHDFIKIVENKMIPNCPVTKDDILAAEHIFGPDLGILKGKTTRQPAPVVDFTLIPVPENIMQRYQNVTLGIDVMHVNGLPFLVTTSLHIKFGTAEYLVNQKKTTLVEAIHHVVLLYCARGFKVVIILDDRQFVAVENAITAMQVTPNFTSRDEHVGCIERFIRTLKERIRADYTMCPFEVLPPLMIIELVYCNVFWLNMFPPKDGQSVTHAWSTYHHHWF